MQFLMLAIIALLLLSAAMVVRLLWERRRGRLLAGWCAVCAGMLVLLILYFLPFRLSLDAAQLGVLDDNGIVAVSGRQERELLELLNSMWFRRTLFESDGRDGAGPYYHLTPRPPAEGGSVSIAVYLPTETSPGLVQTTSGQRALSPQPLFDALEAVRQTAQPLRDVKEELERNGWSHIEVIEGEADSVGRWGGLVLEPASVEPDTVLYTVIGQTEGLYDNPISAVVKLAFHPDSMEWDRLEVFYVSAAGRDRPGSGQDAILPADDADLWDYMYAY